MPAPSTPPRPARLAAAGTVTLDISMYGPGVRGPYVDAGYDVPDLLVDAVPPGGLASRDARATGGAGDAACSHDGDVHRPRRPGVRGPPPARALARQHRAVGGATGVLFSGDAVYDGPLLDELDGCDIPAYVATMRRLRELPVGVVHGGHEPSFGRDRLVELCDAYLAARA